MAEESNDSKEQKQSDVQPPVTPSTDSTNKDINRYTSDEDTAKKTQSGFNIPQPLIVDINKEKTRRIPAVSEIISFIALLISATALMFNKCGLDNTSKALKISEKTFEDNRVKDKQLSDEKIKNETEVKERRIEDSIRKDERDTSYVMAQRSFNTQIKSIKEAQRQFEFVNRPFLEFEKFTVVNFKVNQKFKFEFILENLGNYPLKLLKFRHGSAWRHNVPTIADLLKGAIDGNSAGKFVTKNTPVEIATERRNNLEQITFDKAIKGESFYFLAGEADYINLLNNETQHYEFLVQVSFDEDVDIAYLINRNY